MIPTGQKQETMHVQVAGFVFRIVFLPSINVYIKDEFRNRVAGFFRGFAVPPKEPDVSIRVYHRTDTFGNEKIVRKNRTFFPLKVRIDRNTVGVFYDLSLFQFRTVFFDCITDLMKKDGNFLLLHASSVLVGDRAHLFLAGSGGGKTTITKLLSKHYAVLTEETALLKLTGKRFSLFQLPQIEKDAFPAKSNRSFPVGGLYLLEKSQVNRLSLLTKGAVSSLAKSGAFQKPNKGLMRQLLKSAPLYTLAFSKNPRLSEELAKLLLVQ